MAKSLWCEQQSQCWPLYSQSFVLTVASWLVELCREREEAARNFSVFRTFHNLFGWNKQIFVTKHIFSPSQVRKGKVETIPQKKNRKEKIKFASFYLCSINAFNLHWAMCTEGVPLIYWMRLVENFLLASNTNAWSGNLWISTGWSSVASSCPSRLVCFSFLREFSKVPGGHFACGSKDVNFITEPESAECPAARLTRKVSNKESLLLFQTSWKPLRFGLCLMSETGRSTSFSLAARWNRGKMSNIEWLSKA